MISEKNGRRDVANGAAAEPMRFLLFQQFLLLAFKSATSCADSQSRTVFLKPIWPGCPKRQEAR